MRKLLFTIILVLFGIKDIEAKSSASKTSATPSAVKDVSESLEKWPHLNLLSSTAEKTYYDSLWSPRMSSTLNQKYLLKKFIDTCCDFSFQTQSTGIDGVYQGFASGIHLIFANSSLQFNSKNSSLYNKQGKSLTVRTPALMFSDRSSYKKILTLSPVYCRLKIKNSLSKLVQDSVGCELMRVFITKFAVHKFPKIIFIPATGGLVSSTPFATSSDRLIYSQKDNLNYTKTKFIFFDPDILTRDLELDMIRYNSRTDKFVAKREQNPLEATLFHEMLHCLHDYQGNRSSHSSSIVSQRSKSKSLQIGIHSINNAYSNDEEYHTMYGLTSQGLDLLNESSYLAHRYGFIRTSHVHIPDSSRIDYRRTWRYIKNGDEDLYRYYLSPKSPIKFPKFGVGAYECSDSPSDSR